MRVSGNLPSPSGVAIAILKLTQSEDVQVEDITHLIKADPALTGSLLKIANSSAYYKSEPILSIKDAVIRLGIGVLPRLALSCSVIDANRSGKCVSFDYENFWKTSLLRALIMQHLCKISNLIPDEDAFTIGLISDIGKLALAQVYPEEYSKIIAKTRDCLASDQRFCNSCILRFECHDQYLDKLLRSEREVFSIDNHQIKRWLFSDWGLPDYLFCDENYLQNQDIDFSSKTDLNRNISALLSLSELLSRLDFIDTDIEQLTEKSIQLAIKPFELVGILEKAKNECSEWAEIFGFKNYVTQITEIDSKSNNHDINEKITIMVVEDDRIQAHILRRHFINQGYAVVDASSGEEAIEKIIYLPVDVLVTDYKMQPMDGITLCKALRFNNEMESLYCILITADSSPETIRAAFESGVNDFICKPYKVSELNARMLGAIRAVEMTKKRRQHDQQFKNLTVDLAATTRRLTTVATTDQLTELPNRRHANTRLDQEWANYVRTNKSFAIYSLDLDHFKQINDDYGHDVGDKVLIHFSRVVQNTIRSSDVACRMGGEEFIIVSPNTDVTNIGNLGERICKAVEESQPHELNLRRLITVSIGGSISDKTVDRNGWADTLKRSDQALYNAKLSGRNRFKSAQATNDRKYERIACKLTVKVRRFLDQESIQFETHAVNISKSGMFLKCSEDCMPLLNEIVKISIADNGQIASHISKVVRIEAVGFAVYFLKSEME